MTELTSPTYIEIAQNGRHAWWRYLVTLIIAFAVQLVVVIIAGFAAALMGAPLDTMLSAIQDPAQPLYFFPTIALSFAGLLAGFVVGGMWLHKKPVSDYLGNWKWSAFAFGVVAWLVLLCVDIAMDYGLKPSGFTPGTAPYVPLTVGVTLLALAVQTFAEEFIFRGWLTQGLLKLFKNPIAASVVGGLLFGAMHIPNGLYQAASATVMGIGLALITVRTGSLAIAFGIHLINNVFGAVVVVSGGDVFKGSPGLLVQNTPELNWVDFGFVVVALALVVVAVYRRKP